MHKPVVPIAFPSKKPPVEGLTVLAADIGGTKTDMALFEYRNGQFSILKEKKYVTNDWVSFVAMIQDFGINPKPNRLSIAAAGPVNNGTVKMTNVVWLIDCEEISKALNIEHIFLLNDLEANAYGLAALKEDDFLVVYPGDSKMTSNAAMISPGTGLGEAGLFFNGKEFQPFATEGGHTDFGPHNELEVSLYRFLQNKYDHVSWERLVSGMGICTIYQFLRDEMGREEPAWLKEKLAENDRAATISLAAAKGCEICQETMDLFVTYLAEEAANIALQLNAKGGIFIGGGIIPKIWNEHYKKIFLKQFFEVGRLKYLMEIVPVKIVLNPKTALLGVAYYGAYGVSETELST